MSKFKVGDKVEIKIGLKEGQRGNKANVTRVMAMMCGKSATVVRIDNEGDIILDINPLYAWDTDWINHRREFIVIHRSGNVMTAEHRVNREVIKSAKAKCAPSDTFDFDTGAKLAFDRLMGREEQSSLSPADIFFALTGRPAPEPPKYYTGKVFAVRTVGIGSKFQNRVARNGRIFKIINGKLVENGAKYGLDTSKLYGSFLEFCCTNDLTKWAEVKE